MAHYKKNQYFLFDSQQNQTYFLSSSYKASNEQKNYIDSKPERNVFKSVDHFILYSFFREA